MFQHGDDECVPEIKVYTPQSRTKAERSFGEERRPRCYKADRFVGVLIRNLIVIDSAVPIVG